MENNKGSRKARQTIYKSKFASDLAYRWCLGAWASLNQRTVNGKYANTPSVANNPQQLSYHKKGRTLSISQLEFYNWAASNEDLILSIYASGDKPNVDRVDDAGNYDLGNIQIISATENREKSRKRRPKATGSKYGSLMSTIQNRKAYLHSMEGREVKPKPFDVLILTLRPSKVCEIISKSRQELQEDVEEAGSFGPCSMWGSTAD